MKPNNPTVMAFPEATDPGVFSTIRHTSTPGMVVPLLSTVASGMFIEPVPQVGDNIGVPIAKGKEKAKSISSSTLNVAMVLWYIYKHYHFKPSKRLAGLNLCHPDFKLKFDAFPFRVF